jgi:Cft2 family RNA processing exonuclease
MQIEHRSEGIYLPEIDLWLDAREPVGSNWISHAHADHARSVHGCTYGTPATLELYRLRVPVPETAQLCAVSYGESLTHRDARLTALPAAHIVGAAQLLVEYRGQRLVYTGDIKLAKPLCGATTQIVACDQLIIESTFGLPIYHFLSGDEARQRMVAFARECLDDGAIPAFLGYALGRGQEIVYALRQAGVPVMVHGAIARFLPMYEQHGYQTEGWEPYESKALKGRALVVVPGMRAHMEASGRNIRVAYVSGWAALSNARLRAGAEHLIPYSDHAGFEELLAMVRATGAREVDVVHGYTEAFARVLRAEGIQARGITHAAREAQD